MRTVKKTDLLFRSKVTYKDLPEKLLAGRAIWLGRAFELDLVRPSDGVDPRMVRDKWSGSYGM